MNKIYLILFIASTTYIPLITSAFAASKTTSAKFTGIDYSGVYSCVGSNAKIGNYELLVTFLINKSHSHGNLGRYDLNVETENSITYRGQAIVNGRDMALTIEMVDGNTMTYSTGIARLMQFKNKRFSYINRYYESNQITNNLETNNTGNYGSENCVKLKVKTSAS